MTMAMPGALPTSEPAEARVDIRILGPLEAVVAERPVRLGGPRGRLVLAR